MEQVYHAFSAPLHHLHHLHRGHLPPISTASAYEFSQYHATEMSAKGDVFSYGQHKCTTATTLLTFSTMALAAWTMLAVAPVIFSWMRISVRLQKLLLRWLLSLVGVHHTARGLGSRWQLQFGTAEKVGSFTSSTTLITLYSWWLFFSIKGALLLKRFKY